jgi:hypothetical protein
VFVPEWDGQVCSLGYDVIDWIEAYCCHGPGDVQGKPVTLDDEMASFVVRAYEIDRRTGRRKIDRAVLSRPKGRAKSEVAGFIATAEAFGPVRFDGWSSDGQPVGRPVTSPLIKCLATEESQAGNTFENAAFIVCDFGRDAHPDVFGGASGVRQYQSATAIYLPHGGEMRATTSGAASKDGGKETFVVPDETHLYVHPELRSMYATVARNCGKRKEAEPWMLQTTTAYKTGQSSVAESVLTAWKNGKLPNASHWLVDHREAVGVVDLNNRRHTLEQLRYVYGSASGWMDLDRIYRTMLDPTECETPEVAARYFLNLPSDSDAEGGAFDVAAWNACADPSAERGRTQTFGVATAPDGSWSAIAVAWTRADGLPQLMLADYRPGTAWLSDRVAELRRAWGGNVVVDSATRGLVTDADAPSQQVQAQAHNALAAAIEGHRLRWAAAGALGEKSAAMTTAVKASRWRLVGDTRVLDRKGSTDTSPIVAAALAAWGVAKSAGRSIYEDRGLELV